MSPFTNRVFQRADAVLHTNSVFQLCVLKGAMRSTVGMQLGGWVRKSRWFISQCDLLGIWNKDLWGGGLRLHCNFRSTPHIVPPTDVETVEYPHNWCWWTPPVLFKHKPFNWVVNLIWNHENSPFGNVTAEGRPTENCRGKNWTLELYEIIF